MKRIIYILLVVLLLASYNSCSSKSKEIEINNYILSLEVTNKQVRDVSIDNFAKEIIIELAKHESKNNVRIKLTLADGVSVIQPESVEADYDLNSTFTLILLAKGKEIRYHIRVVGFIPDTNPALIGWEETLEFGSLPDGIKVYKSPAQLAGKSACAYIAVADTKKNRNYYVLGEPNGSKTPNQFYESSNRMYPVIMNAGYFWNGSSLSLICRNGIIECPNLQVVTRSNGSENAAFYPTRGVFSNLNNNIYRTDWVFTTVTPGTTYAYPVPAPNKTGSNPLPVPSMSFPSGAWVYSAHTAIGGGPVLVKNGVYQNTWEVELYDTASGIGPTSNNPRSAIGSTNDSKLIFFVCEGRNMTPGVAGLTLQDVAEVMMQLGCVEVLNLDGGGSSCMIINGINTIKPSDGNQRAVVTAIGLK